MAVLPEQTAREALASCCSARAIRHMAYILQTGKMCRQALRCWTAPVCIMLLLLPTPFCHAQGSLLSGLWIIT